MSRKTVTQGRTASTHLPAGQAVARPIQFSLAAIAKLLMHNPNKVTMLADAILKDKIAFANPQRKIPEFSWLMNELHFTKDEETQFINMLSANNPGSEIILRADLIRHNHRVDPRHKEEVTTSATSIISAGEVIYDPYELINPHIVLKAVVGAESIVKLCKKYYEIDKEQENKNHAQKASYDYSRYLLLKECLKFPARFGLHEENYQTIIDRVMGKINDDKVMQIELRPCHDRFLITTINREANEVFNKIVRKDGEIQAPQTSPDASVSLSRASSEPLFMGMPRSRRASRASSTSNPLLVSNNSGLDTIV